VLSSSTPDGNSPADSEFAYDPNDETGLIKELVLQVRKVIGPFAAPKKVYIVSDLPKTRSGKVRIVWTPIR
jgi:acyl-coenzyme A synthetase/AMP-(fatty) acid ligase